MKLRMGLLTHRRPFRRCGPAVLACLSLVLSLLAPAIALGVGSAPSWTDSSLAGMQVGVYFEDGVQADGTPAPSYSVTAGTLPDGLALDSFSGQVTGTPTTAGAFDFTITADNGVPDAVTQQFTGEVAPEDPPADDPPTPTAPQWVDTTLADMQYGVPYTDGVSASGYPAPTYLQTGYLPDGLVFDEATGAITGTPTVDGGYDFTITASNGVDPFIWFEFIGTVAAEGESAPVWVKTSMPEMRAGAYVEFYFSVTGNPNSTFEVTAGTLPDGLDFDGDNGEIWGEPVNEGPYDFTVTASNGIDPDAANQFTGTIGAEGTAPAWTDSTLTEFYLNVPVSDGVAATGDPTPHYSVSDGDLPSGLTLDEDTGAITGTPDYEGYYDFEIAAENAYDTIYIYFEGTVWPEPAGGGAPYFSDITLKSAYVTVAYSDGVAATGTPAPTYTLASGDLPDGLSLDGDTGAISGTPSTEGEYVFEITASNGVEPDVTHEFAMVVGPAPRGCVSYTAKSYVGAMILNADGTPVGCGTTSDKGAPTDLFPTNWATTWDEDFGTNSGNGATYTQRLGFACDDCWIGAGGEDSSRGLPIGFPINFYGTTYTTVYVNSNGSISFGHGSDNYNDPLNEILDGAAGVVAFGIDLDNRALTASDSDWESNRHIDFFYWGRTTYNGHAAFVATWMNMNGYSSRVSKSDFNTFQIVIVDVDGAGGSDVDIIVNYGSLMTTYEGYDCPDDDSITCLAIGLGTVSGGVVKYASMIDDAGTLYNGLPCEETVDGGSHALSSAHLNSSVAGQFKFQMRGGQLPETASEPGAPVITSAERGDGIGTIEWDAPTENGNSPILGYNIRWRVAYTTDDWETDEASGSPYEISYLDNGTTYEVQVQAVNGVGESPWSGLAYFTPGADGSLDWEDLTIGSMLVGVPYSDGVSASGSPAATYSVTDGDLPDGLSLNPNTGAITGTPTTAGAYDFTITASNGESPDLTLTFTGWVQEGGMDLDKTSTGPLGTVHVTGWGFAPGTDVDIYLHSVPVWLATVTADEDGEIAADVIIPGGTANGAHRLVLEGIDPSEHPLVLSESITIGGSGTTLPPTATASDPSGANGGSALPLVAGLGLLAGMIGMGLTTRRRRLN
jgi:hypothetical protein